MSRAEELKRQYQLERHPEGGWFSEYYSAPFLQEGRPLAGSIYFLLDAGEISHFHQIDCDELWYFHEGCGLRLTLLLEGRREELLLGTETGQRAAAVIPAGAVFAAENLSPEGFTFLSCATAPAFRYEGFRLVSRKEITALAPGADDLLRLAYEA